MLRRIGTLLAVGLLALGSSAAAQDAEPDDAPRPPGSPFDAESYVALSADQDAQSSLSGFRDYLERTRAVDEELYQLISPRLSELEERNVIADVIFWTATGLAVAALVSAIPVNEYLGLDPALGFIFGGAGTFALGLVIQAVLRPGQGDLVALIDLHDERLGRR